MLQHLLAGDAATKNPFLMIHVSFLMIYVCPNSSSLCRAASMLQTPAGRQCRHQLFPPQDLCVFSHTARVQGCVCAATPTGWQCHHQGFSPQIFMCVLSHCTLLSHCLRAGLRLCCNTCLPAMPLPNIFPSGFMCLLSHCPRAGLRLCCNTCWLVMPPPRSAFCTFLLSSPLFPDPLLNS